MSTATNRRHFHRSVFHAPVRVSMRGQSYEALMHDVSLRGALVEFPTDCKLEPGDKCVVHLSLAAGTSIRMENTVAHTKGRLAGMHCDHIDLDSMTHLRQLVEHNAQDPALLDRDLGLLVTRGG